MLNRLLALDILRGITILFMVIVNNPGSWNAVYAPLLHAEWNGCTPTDLVFPFFIVIVGIAIPFANPNPKCSLENFSKITSRSLRLIYLGLFLNCFNLIQIDYVSQNQLLIIRLIFTVLIGIALFGNFKEQLKLMLAIPIFCSFILVAFFTETFENLRLMGVLQRIGLVYFIATLCYFCCSKYKLIFVASVLLIGYWLLLVLVPVPNSMQISLEKGTNLVAYIDQILLRNHVLIATKPWDPEGVLSTFPAIAQAIIGILIGTVLKQNIYFHKKFYFLFAIGLLFFIIGSSWAMIFPLNKILWSSSFVMFTTGIAMLFLAFLFYISHAKFLKKFLIPFQIWGLNPILIFFLSGIIPRILAMIKCQNPANLNETISIQTYFFNTFLIPNFDCPKDASLFYAFLYVAFFFLLLYILFKRKIVIKV